MATATRHAGHWAVLVPTVARKRLIALAISPALALLGVLIAPAVQAEAFGCNYLDNVNATVTVTDPGGTFKLSGQQTAGHYSGNTIQPSTTGVSAAGIEAQCLLKLVATFDPRANPGPVDGIFGPMSQAAAEEVQDDVNTAGARILEDGMVGPQTWPWLRCEAQHEGCHFQRL